ncbi:MAG: DUF1673 family protein [Methanomicrobiaceae archaeon]|nr:DUF1673 family protein [Methanomicrobiaceae archaeon]
MTKFADVVRKYLGWCPLANMPVERRQASGMGYPHLPGSPDVSASGEEGTVVNCDLISPRILLATLFAFAGFFLLFVFCFFLPEWRPAFYLLIGLAFVAYAAVQFYFNRKRAVMEFLQNSIIIRRPILGALVIEKWSVRAIKVKKTKFPVPPRVFAVLCLLSVAAVVFNLIHCDLFRLVNGQAVTPDVGYYLLFTLGFAAFLLELCYHACSRLHYPGFVKIALAGGETVHLYAENPGELAARVGGYSDRMLRFGPEHPAGTPDVLPFREGTDREIPGRR